MTAGRGPHPRVAAVVLARDRPAPLKATLEAILAQEPPVDALLLVDNDATPEVAAALAHAAARHPDAEVIRTGYNAGCAGGFAAGLARGLERGDCELFCGFDDDAEPLPGCIGALVDAAEKLPDAGIVGATAHAPDGTLAWPMYVEGEAEPARTVADIEALAARRANLPVANVAWQGLMIPASVLRAHGNVWGELFLQYEDLELGLRLASVGLRVYVVPQARCLHPAPPAARELRLLGRRIEITTQSPAKEYLTLRNALVVRRRYDGRRFWYGTGPLILVRGLLSTLGLGTPRGAALREVFLRGVLDAVRGRLGPPPARTVALGTRARIASGPRPANR